MRTYFSHNIAHLHTLASPAITRSLLFLEQKEELKALCSDDVILGGGSNVICMPEISERLVKLEFSGVRVVEESEQSALVAAEAGMVWHDFVAWCVEHGYCGLENLALIYGTVGAAPVQNIGAYGVEVGESIERIEVYDREAKRFDFVRPEDCDFRYRHSQFKAAWKKRFVISEVWFRLNKQATLNLRYPDLQRYPTPIDTPKALFEAIVTIRKQKLPNPEEHPNVGSFFHNPVVSSDKYAELKSAFPDMPAFAFGEQWKIPAAWLIERSGFKGVRDGLVGISEQHALVLVNYGGTGNDILRFASRIQREIQNRFSLNLAIEPNILGEP
ncbi:MAG: UDP-N-acetylmuramate dehydrogenase [Cardiobacteriaceae bacterium]|nr:UDP-N-acetylmuramate dehydrogenase [Cardiobacteriaceae bacterium]